MSFVSTINKLRGVRIAAQIMRNIAVQIRYMPGYRDDLEARGHVSALTILALSNLLAPNHLLVRLDRARAALEMLERRADPKASAVVDSVRVELANLYDLVDQIDEDLSRPGAVFTQAPPKAEAPPKREPLVEVMPARLSRASTQGRCVDLGDARGGSGGA